MRSKQWPRIVYARLSETQFRKLHELAEELDRSMSWILRTALERLLREPESLRGGKRDGREREAPMVGKTGGPV